MKKKPILILASLTLLASCSSGQSSVPSTVTDLKAAASAEASKESVRYNMNGDVSFKGTYAGETLMDVDIDNLDFETSIKNLNGGLLKASSDDYKTADIYLEGSVGKLDFASYRDGAKYVSFDADAGGANAYLKSNNLYADLSDLDLSKAVWDGVSGDELPSSKLALNGFMDVFSFRGIGYSGLDFSMNDIESYILRDTKYCNFSSAGNSQVCEIKINRDQISSLYVAINMANWMANEMPKIDSDMQDNAMIAKKNAYKSEIASMVPAFDLSMKLTYSSSGLSRADVDFSTTISPNALDNSADKKYLYAYDIDVTLSSRNAPSFPDINPSDYTAIRF